MPTTGLPGIAKIAFLTTALSLALLVGACAHNKAAAKSAPVAKPEGVASSVPAKPMEVREVAPVAPENSQRPIPPDKSGARAASVYWPLNLGNTWVYSRDFLGEKGTLSVTILKRDAEGYYIDSAGGRLMSTPFGLRDPDRYLLQAPVEKGQTWKARLAPGKVEYFEILEDDVAVSVPAGRYEHCVVVRSTTVAPGGGRLVNLVSYAPYIGMIKAETLVLNNQQRQARQVLLELLRAELP